MEDNKYNKYKADAIVIIVLMSSKLKNFAALRLGVKQIGCGASLNTKP